MGEENLGSRPDQLLKLLESFDRLVRECPVVSGEVQLRVRMALPARSKGVGGRHDIIS